MKRTLLLLMLCLLVPGLAQALNVTGNFYSLDTQFEYLADPKGELSIQDLLQHPQAYPFAHSSNSKPDNTFEPVWLKLELSFSEAEQNKKYSLFGRVENLYDIRLYREDEFGTYQEFKTGNNYPAASREIDALRYGFHITPSAKPMTVYIRYVGGPGTNSLPWNLVETQTYEKKSHQYFTLDIASLSGIGAMLVFNLVIALSLRRKDYMYYCAYVFSVIMALFTLDGAGFYYLWPDSPWINDRALQTFNLLSCSLRLLAIVSFLEIAHLSQAWNIASKWVLVVLAITLMAVNTAGITNLPPYAATLPWAVGIAFGFALCIYAITQRVKLAWPLLITLGIPSTAALIQALITINSQHIDVLELQIAKLGFALHVLLFSLCLAAHIKIQAESHLDAMHDNLTGLPGVALLHERFEWAANLSQRKNWKMVVLFIDLDGFKQVNDTLGHAAGDHVLMQVAARMQGVLRQTDFVARLGGDEFVVLLVDLGREEVIDPVVEKLLTVIATPYRVGKKETRISASIGIAMYPEEGQKLGDLLKAADNAMYHSKRNGKNSYTLSGIGAVKQPVSSSADQHSPGGQSVY
jgi:diguanylate cyclase (GGDEF)-like protein